MRSPHTELPPQKYMALSATAKEEAMMAWAFEHSSNAKLITNLNHEIQTVNKAFLDWFEFTEKEVIGQHAAVLLRSRACGPELETQIPKNLETTSSWQGEVLNKSKSGKERPCLLSITSIYSPDGNKIGYLGVQIDLSERKKLEAQMAHGEKLSNIGESVATLMHEVRNPLSGISMNVDMLESAAKLGKSWSSVDIESIEMISKEIKRLDALVRNTLSYARNTQLQVEKVILRNFYAEVNELVVVQAKKCSVEIEIETIPETLWAMFDPDPMKQVILNLAQNGIEAASHASQPMLRLGVREAEGPEWRYISPSAKVLLFTVDNSGDPIPEEVARNLFKPFFTSRAEGLGLGLAIASKIVRQHNGILGHSTIDDKPYATRFTVALPI